MENKGSYFPRADVSGICRKMVETQETLEITHAIGDDVDCILVFALTPGTEPVTFNKAPQLCGSFLFSF